MNIVENDYHIIAEALINLYQRIRLCPIIVRDLIILIKFSYIRNVIQSMY